MQTQQSGCYDNNDGGWSSSVPTRFRPNQLQIFIVTIQSLFNALQELGETNELTLQTFQIRRQA